jgi:hypothetical protein
MPSSYVIVTLQPRIGPDEVKFGLAASTTWAAITYEPVLVTNSTLFGIVAKANQPAHAIISCNNDTTISYGCSSNLVFLAVPFRAAISYFELSYLNLHPGARDHMYILVWIVVNV